MSKQINQYTKSRNRADITNSDLLDVDSSDDNGTTRQSAKLPIGELTQYIANIFTFYRSDGNFPLTNNIRTVDFNGGKLKFEGGGDVELRGVGLSNYGFSVHNLTDVERARLGTDDALDTGEISLSNSSGEFFNASDGEVNSLDGYFMDGNRVLRPDGATNWIGEGFSRLRLNPTGRVYLDKTMWVSTSQPIASSAQPSNVFIQFSNELTLSTLGKTSPTTNDAMLFKAGIPVVDTVGLTETLFHFQNNGVDLLDIKANGNVLMKSSGSDVSLLIQDNLSQDRAVINYDSGLDTGEISLSNSSGEFFSASDGEVNIKGNDSSIALKVDADNRSNVLCVGENTTGVFGFVAVNRSTPIGNAVFSVNGNIANTGVMAIGNAPSIGNCLSMPENFSITIGGGARLGVDGGGTYVDSGALDEIKFRRSTNDVYARLLLDEFSIISQDATIIGTIQEEKFNIISQYWDGSVSQEKESSIVHNITSAPSGDSQLDFSIAGTDILTLKDTGVLNAANLPTSSAGLVTGDIWNDGGTLKIV